MTTQVSSPHNSALTKEQIYFLKAKKKIYFIAIGTLALLLIFAFATQYYCQRKLTDDSFFVNISGRQRMLTQQTALLKTRELNGSKSDSNPTLLSELLEIHKSILNSRFLLDGDSELKNIYWGPGGIDSELSNYYLLLTSARPNVERIFEQSQRLLGLFEQSTQIIQSRAKHDQTLCQQDLFFILLMTLLILILELIFIFIPMIRHTQNQFKKINYTSEKSLQSARLSALGEMSSSIAHEIGGPMAVVQMSLESLVKKLISGNPIDAHLIKSHENMLRQTQRVVHLLDSVRMHSRSHEKDPLVLAPVNQMISTSLEVLKGKIHYSQVQVHLSGVSADQQLTCRPSAIIQILTNLINNAIDAVEALPIDNRKIEITTAVTEAGHIIRVIDSGSGVDPHLSEQIFESFFTTKSPGKGTGLGLSISQKIAMEHGGYLKVNFDISNSCFELFLPK